MKKSKIIKINIIALSLMSVSQLASATPLFACKTPVNTMVYNSSGCKAPTVEVYRRLDSRASSKFNIVAPALLPSVPTENIFSPASFWYKKIPVDAPLAVNSPALVQEFINQKVKYYNNVTINTVNYAAPVHTVNAQVAPVKVGFNNCQNKSYVDGTFSKMLSDVPIPNNAMAAGGTDGEMAIYQPSTDTYWEMWKAQKNTTTGEWKACWGGRINNLSKSDGAFLKNYGTTATGLPFIGGQITAEELSAGVIKHAIGIALVDTDASWVVSYPANRSDGYNPKNVPNRIAEGQRFRLDPTIDVSKLNMTRVGKIVAKAAQDYGFIVWDKAGSVSLRAQNPSTYTLMGKPNPYPALFEGKPAYAVLNGMPWDKLKFLPKDYGKP